MSAGEAARLALDDIDWRARGHKHDGGVWSYLVGTVYVTLGEQTVPFEIEAVEVRPYNFDLGPRFGEQLQTATAGAWAARLERLQDLLHAGPWQTVTIADRQYVLVITPFNVQP